MWKCQCDKKKRVYVKANVDCTGLQATEEDLAAADEWLPNWRRKEEKWVCFSGLDSAGAAGVSAGQT